MARNDRPVRYLLHYTFAPGWRGRMQPAVWEGRATAARLDAHVQASIGSLEPGGCNRPLVEAFGMPTLTGAKLVRQADGAIVVDLDVYHFHARSPSTTVGGPMKPVGVCVKTA